MVRRFHISTEFAFLFSGVLIVVMVWGANLLGRLAGETSSGHGGDELYLWLILMFQGLAFSTVGAVYENYRELMASPILTKRYIVGYLFIADGALHLLALNQHLGEFFPALFFAVVAPAQILVGMFYPRLHRGLDSAWFLFTAFLIASFAVTRTFAVWPIGVVDAVDPLGIISKLVELLTVWLLISLVRAARTETRNRQQRSPAQGP